MNFKRIGRMVICMILVCCFLVNAFSIRAKATGVGTAALYALGAVAVEVVVAAAFQALGVMSGSDSSTFRSYVNDAVTWLTNSTTYVTNGMVQVLGFMSPDGVVKSFALKDMIQDLWQWMFDSGTVVSTTAFQTYVPVGTYYRDYQDNSNPVMVFRWCSLVDYNTTYYQYNLSEYAVCMEPDYRFVFGYQGSSTVLVGGKSYWYRSIIGNTVSSTSGYVQKTNVDNFFTTTAAGFEYIPNAPNLQSLLDIYGFSEIYADPGVTLGQIQSPYLTTDTDEETIQIEIAPIYVDWTTGQVSQRPSSNDDEKIWLPLGVPSTDLDEILTQNQDQAQSGDTSLDFDFETSTDPGTGTDPDTGTDIEPNPDPDSGTNTGSGSWTPPSDMGKFTLDLKDYFPFCIPFDLYDFFVCLNADPVAPVIEWVIPLPGGETYPLEIDLSVFDPVAQLLRRLQLLLFCVGLAFKTRDLIKG